MTAPVHQCEFTDAKPNLNAHILRAPSDLVLEYAPPDLLNQQECLDWLTHKYSDIHKWSASHLRPLGHRLLILCAASLGLSIIPVLFPFGNPYDISVMGFVHNTGYFIGYTGVGWSMAWYTYALWASRVLGVGLPWKSVIGIPTLFAVVLFLSMYLLVGGPFPLGTLTLGLPCFLVFWYTMWRFMIQGAAVHVDDASAGMLRRQGKRVIVLFAASLLQLVAYFIVTCTVMRLPDQADTIAVVFVLSEEMLLHFAGDIPGFVFDEGDTVTAAQQQAAELMKFVFFCLHATYTTFLFPVLADIGTVVLSAVVSVVLNIVILKLHLSPVTSTSWRGTVAADDRAKLILARSSHGLVTLVCPLLFAGILAVDNWSYNTAMFHVLSDRGGIGQAIFGCMLNSGAALVTIAVSLAMTRTWLHEHQLILCVLDAPVQLNDQARPGWELKQSHKGKDRWYGPHRKRLKHPTIESHMSLMEVEEGVANRELHCAILTEYTVVRTASLVLDSIVHAMLDGSQDFGSPSKVIPENVDSTPSGSLKGGFELLVATFACMNTFVGVCMVMKHDGMAIQGWLAWLFDGGEVPYPFRPSWR